jgi:hypothetical protein
VGIEIKSDAKISVNRKKLFHHRIHIVHVKEGIKIKSDVKIPRESLETFSSSYP